MVQSKSNASIIANGRNRVTKTNVVKRRDMNVGSLNVRARHSLEGRPQDQKNKRRAGREQAVSWFQSRRSRALRRTWESSQQSKRMLQDLN